MQPKQSLTCLLWPFTSMQVLPLTQDRTAQGSHVDSHQSLSGMPLGKVILVALFSTTPHSLIWENRTSFPSKVEMAAAIALSSR